MSLTTLWDALLAGLEERPHPSGGQYLPREEIYKLMKKETGQDFGYDVAKWLEWALDNDEYMTSYSRVYLAWLQQPKITLETERLRLYRPTAKSETEYWQHYDMREFDDFSLTTVDPLELARSHKTTPYGYYFCLSVKPDPTMIGAIFTHSNNDGDQHLIQYYLGKSWRNKGYMTEALTEVIRYLFEETDLKKIWAMVFNDNEPSIRLLTKMGMQFNSTKKVTPYHEERDLDYYLLTRDEWLKSRDKT